jgi:serine/threonine protein kinase
VILKTGNVLNSRYRIVSLLGKGGFGAVYKAWDVSLRKQCSVKQNFEISPEAEREAVILADLDDPHLPRVTDHFTVPGEGQYLVMDYIEGEDLQAKINDGGGPLPEDQVLPWIEQVCDALDYLHSQHPPIIHRDIKPANIRITSQGQAFLVDFGIAKIYNPNLKTTIGARAFTPGYSPPEQYGRGSTDPRTDIYALGATLYSLLTGLEPVESTQRFGADPLIPADRVNPHISPQIPAILHKSMQLDPSKRFQNVVDLKAVLTSQQGLESFTFNQAALGGNTQTFKTQTFTRQGFNIQPMRKWILWAAGFLIIVLAAVLIFSLTKPPGLETASATVTDNMEIVVLPTSSSTPEPTPVPLKPEETVAQSLVLETVSSMVSETASPSPTSVSNWNQGRLVYVVDNSSKALYTLDLENGSSPKLLIDPGSDIWLLAPSWSPDSSRIAYHQYGGSMQVVNLSGGVYPRVLHDCTVASWSPDGRYIICKRNGADDFDIVDSDNGNLIRSISMESGVSLPAWSPSDDEFVYVVYRDDQHSIWVSSMDGGNPWLIAGDSPENYAPSWSPDGQRVAYQSRMNSTLSEIWIVDRDGRNEQRITFTPEGYWSRAPSWSPDGHWLVFVSNQDVSNGAESGEIYAVSLETLEVVRITNTDGRVYNWRVSWGK